MRTVQLARHLSTDELEQRYRQAREPHERTWWQIVWLVARGQSARAVADSVGYSAYWVGKIVQRYNTEGPAGMINRRHTQSRRAPMLLSSSQLDDLRQALAGPPPAGERWTSQTVANWMAERLGRPVPKQRGWDYLQRLGARLLQPRPRHVAASAQEQEAFKKKSAR